MDSFFDDLILRRKKIEINKDIDINLYEDNNGFKVELLKLDNSIYDVIYNIDRKIKLTKNEIKEYMKYNIVSFGQFCELMGWKSFASINQYIDKLDVITPFLSKSRRGHKFIKLNNKAINMLLDKAKK